MNTDLVGIVGLAALAFALGLDSFRTSAALGTVALRPAERRRLVFLFGVSDGLAPLVGLALGGAISPLSVWVPAVGVAILVLAGALTVAGSSGPERLTRMHWSLVGVPVALSFDNLVAGVGLGTFGAPVLLAPVFGIASGLMSALGFELGKSVIQRVPVRPDLVSGVALIAAGLAVISFGGVDPLLGNYR